MLQTIKSDNDLKNLLILSSFYFGQCSTARIAQSVERETFNLKAEGSTPSSGAIFFLFAHSINVSFVINSSLIINAQIIYFLRQKRTNNKTILAMAMTENGPVSVQISVSAPPILETVMIPIAPKRE